ncbi:MAG: hypothetical protein IJ862_01335, partial [Selenomonadaceae bacterium]|nr:hypothetical protein [Selenomonadaceae bacterium]
MDSNIIIKPGDTTITGGVNKTVYVKSVRGDSGGSFDGGDYVLSYNLDSNKVVNAKDYGSIGSYIYNKGLNVSLNVSDFDDAVINASRNVFIDTKAGNDVIFNNNNGKNVTINSGAGNDVIHSLNCNNVLINAGEGNDYMYEVTGQYITVNGGAGDDTIFYLASPYSGEDGYSYLNGGEGNDLIKNTSTAGYTDEVTIDGGTGDDNIYNNGSYGSINGGAGNDTILATINVVTDNDPPGEYMTIVGGKGNDKITITNINKTLIQYSNGDGKDTIYGYNETDTIQIAADSYTTQINGSDVIINVGTGSMLVKDAKDKTLNIINLPPVNEPTLGGSENITLNNIIHAFRTNGSDIFVRTNNEERITVEGGVNKTIYVKSVYNSVEGSLDGNYILGYNLDSNKVVNAKDYTSIGSYIYNSGSNVSLSVSDFDDAVLNDGGSNVLIDTKNGNDVIFNNVNYKSNQKNVTINSGAGDDSIHSWQCNNVLINAGEGNDNMDAIMGSNITVNGDGGNDYICYFLPLGGVGYSQLNGGDGNDTIENSYALSPIDEVTIDGGSGNDYIINSGGYGSINGGTGDDTIYATSGISSTKEEYMTVVGGKGNDRITVTYVNKTLIQYANGDGSDTIHGYNETDTIHITEGSYITQESGNDVIINVGSGSMTVKDAKGKTLNIIGNKYLPPVDTVDGGSSTSTVSGGTSTSTVSGGTSTSTVSGGTSTPTISGGTSTLAAGSVKTTLTDSDTSSSVTIGAYVKTVDATSRTKAVKIIGNALANTIRGGSGVDTIYGGAGNDSILGNSGNDKLFGDAGNDTLRGGAGNDSIQGGAGADKLFGDAGNDTLRGGAGNDSIQGGAGADKLFGDAGNDTLYGGAGSDSIQGGNGADRLFGD